MKYKIEIIVEGDNELEHDIIKGYLEQAIEEDISKWGDAIF